MPIVFFLVFIAAEVVGQALGFSVQQTYQVVWAGVMGAFLALAYWVDRPR